MGIFDFMTSRISLIAPSIPASAAKGLPSLAILSRVGESLDLQSFELVAVSIHIACQFWVRFPWSSTLQEPGVKIYAISDLHLFLSSVSVSCRTHPCPGQDR